MSTFSLLLFSAPATTQSNLSSGIATSQLLSMLFSLITVLAIIMLLAWLLRRFNLGVQGNSGAIKVLTTLTLGKSERLVLVEVGEQQLLLGVTAQNITLLQTLEQPLELSSQPLQATPRLFQEKLKGFLNKTEKS